MSTEPFPQQPEPGADATPPASSVPSGEERTPPAGYPPFEPSGGPAADSPGPGGPVPSGTDRFFASVRRSGWTRSDDRWVGGVAGGVAERLGWDPLLVRGLLFVSFFLTGVGLIVYAAGWALLPERRDGRIHLEEATRGNFDSALIGAGVAAVAGMFNADGIGWGWGWGGHGWIAALFWLAVWGTAGWFVYRYIRERRDTRPQDGGPMDPAQNPAGVPFTAPAAPGTFPAPGTTAEAGEGAANTSPAQPFSAPSAAASPSPAATSPASSTTAWAAAPSSSPASGISGADSRAEAQAQAARARAQARAEAAQLKAQAARQAAEARAYAAQQRAEQARAAAAERAARPITKSAGGGTVGIVFGLLLIAGALLIAADRGRLWLPWPFNGAIDPALAWVGVALVIIGAGIVISGIRGRSSGWLGFLAILGLGIGIPWAMVTNADGSWTSSSDSARPDGSAARAVSEGTTVARSIPEAERGFRGTFGEPTVDLTALDLSDVSPGDPVEVPVEFTAGDLTIRVPRDIPVEAEVRLWGGQVIWEVDRDPVQLNRVGGGTAHLSSDEAVDDGAVLRLLVSSRFGNVTILED